MPSLRETIDKSDNNSLATLIAADYLDNNFIITDIEPIFFQGIIGAPLNVYDTSILYFCIHLKIYEPVAVSPTQGFISLHNEFNALFVTTGNGNPYWDAVAAAVRYISNPFEIKDFYTSRISNSVYNRIRFIGYKLTI